ncbi:MAG TPA: hypothetical protein VFZ34_30440 [Blastocatellia bacterium]|nr:hypothetical protein [Blastocatellia bacterium]
MRRMQKITGWICLLSVVLSFVIAPLEAQGKRKSRITKSKKGAAMLTDQEIKDALKEGATIALVNVEATDVEAPGTRGHQTFYKLKVAQNLVGSLTGTVEARRYGAPVVQKGQAAIVVLLPASNSEHPLQAFVIVPEGKQSEVVKAHIERIEKLKSAK